MWAVANNTIAPDWESWSFDKRAKGADPTLTAYMGDRTHDLLRGLGELLLLTTPSEKRPVDKPIEIHPTLAVNSVVGRLGIPRLGVRAVVREGDQEQTLFSSLGHIPGTALPGEKGNVGIAGHRDTFFRSLAKIKTNDVLQFETAGGTYSYEVTGTQIVKPKDVGVLRSGAIPEITLVTCYPFGYIGNAPDRFIVKARQLPSREAQQVSQVIPPPPVVSAVSRPIPQREEPSIESPGKTREKVSGRRTAKFALIKNHTQILAPGVFLGISDMDAERGRFTAWLWVKGNARTDWIRDQSAGKPVIFQNEATGERYQFTVTQILDGIASASLLLPEPRITASNTN